MRCLNPMANTRVYVKGVLDAEGFPVADVSDHLAREGHGRVGRPVRSDARRNSTSSPTSSACTSSPSRTRSARTSVRSSTTTRRTCSSSATRRSSIPRQATLDTTEIDAFINERWLITVRKDDGFTMDRVKARWDRSPDLAVNGVSFLLYGLLDVGRRRLLRRRSSCSTTSTTRSARVSSPRQPMRPSRSAALVQDAAGADAVPPARRPDARGGQRADAP